MPTMTMTVKKRTTGLLGRALTARVTELVAAERAARATAAATATTATRAAWHYKRPANTPARPGRDHTPGQFANGLTWLARNNQVEFDIQTADRNARYWIIQEIGTKKKATLKRGGAKNPRGRPKAGANYVRTVRSQRGRKIPGSLVWADGPGGQYHRPDGSRHDQQLQLRAKITHAPIGPHTAARAMYISREIKGQHFVRKGAIKGFHEYRPSVLAAARRAFAGQGYRS